MGYKYYKKFSVFVFFIFFTSLVSYTTNFSGFIKTASANSDDIVTAVVPLTRRPDATGINLATYFLLMINTSGRDGKNCLAQPAFAQGLSATYFYQALDAAGMPIASIDTPVDVADSEVQLFAIAFDPQSAFASRSIVMDVKCDNLIKASSTKNLNQPVLGASSGPDIDLVVQLTATSLEVPAGGVALLAVGSTNVGNGSGDVTVGINHAAIPEIACSVCQIDTQGACINPPEITANLNYGVGSNNSVAIFCYSSNKKAIRDSENRRLTLDFLQDGNLVGQSSFDAYSALTPSCDVVCDDYNPPNPQDTEIRTCESVDGVSFETRVCGLVLNSPPEITNPGDKTTTLGSLVNYHIQASDPDASDTLSFTGSGMPPGVSVITSTDIQGRVYGLVFGTANTIGIYNPSITVTDSSGASTSTTFSLSINSDDPANNVPIITNPNVISQIPGEEVYYQIDASDPDGDSLTFTLTQLPVGLDYSTSTGLITGISETRDYVRTFVTVDDGRGGVVDFSFHWLFNRPPVVNFNSVPVTRVGETVNTILYSDPDGDDITINSATNFPPGLSLTASGSVAVVTGVPTEVGDFQPQVQYTDGSAGGTSVLRWVITTGICTPCQPEISNINPLEIYTDVCINEFGEEITQTCGPGMPPMPLDDNSLEGIDADFDGIRDDVENALVTEVSNPTALTMYVDMAKAYQSIIMNSANSTITDQARAIIQKSNDCLQQMDIDSPMGKGDEYMIPIMINNMQRLQAYKSFLDNISGTALAPAKPCIN